MTKMVGSTKPETLAFCLLKKTNKKFKETNKQTTTHNPLGTPFPLITGEL